MKKLTLLFPLLMLLTFESNAQNVYRLNYRFESSKLGNLQEKDSKSNKVIAKMLKGYIVKKDDEKDELYIKFWNITKDKYKGDKKIINSDDNGKTFTYKIKWEENRYLKIPFSATAITAANIPFRYRLKKDADLEAEFLNVGANLFFIRGNTKFFKQEQIEPRQSYWGFGPFIGFSQQEINSTNTGGNIMTEKKVAALNYGASVVRSWSGFNLILAVGFDNAIGSKAKYWENNNFKGGLKPWIGFGFGFKLIDLSIKTKNDED